MNNTNDKYGFYPLDTEGLQLNHRAAQDKLEAKNEPFDPGLATLGTDNEAATPPDLGGMVEARRNSTPL